MSESHHPYNSSTCISTRELDKKMAKKMSSPRLLELSFDNIFVFRNKTEVWDTALKFQINRNMDEWGILGLSVF